MAWYNSQMNGWPEPANFMHHPATSDGDGTVSRYSKSHRSERYEAKKEQTFQFRGPLGMYKEHSMDGDPFLVPLGLARGRPEKGDDFYKGNSHPTRDHEIGKYNYLKNKDDEYESDDEEYVKNTKEGSKKNFFKDEGYDHNEKYKGNGHGHGHGQTQPRKHTYYDNSYDYLDLEKEKGEPHHAPNYTSNKYTAPSYNPKQETYYERAPTYYNEKHKGNGNDDYTPPCTVPTIIRPRKETYYDTSNNRPMMMLNPPPIRTRTDRGRDAEFYNEGKNAPKYNIPHYNSSSRKDHRGFGEMIDSSEARRRYGKVLPRDVAYVAHRSDGQQGGC